MIYLSASGIKDFLACPAKVYYRRNHPDSAIPNKEMIEGSIVHLVIEKFPFSSNEGIIFAQNQLDGKEYLDSKKIFICLDNFYNHYSPFLKEDDLVEWGFAVPKNGYTLVGKIDRISDGIIYDWKSSFPKTVDIKNDIQFILYRHCYEEIFKKEPKKVCYVSLLNNKTFVLNRNDYDYYEDILFEEIIPNVVEELSHGSFPRLGIFKDKTCNKCSYRKICLGENEE